VRNNPLNLTDPTALDFYLNCDKNNGTTCQGGHQYYEDKDGNYQETVVKSDKNGNLTDQSGNKYTGTFDGKNVNFTQDGSKQSSTGDWKQNSNDTKGIHGTGSLLRTTTQSRHFTQHSNSRVPKNRQRRPWRGLVSNIGQ